MNKFFIAFLAVFTLGAGCDGSNVRVISGSEGSEVTVNGQKVDPNNGPIKTNGGTTVVMINQNNGERTFTREDLGLSFTYPDKFGDVNFEMGPSPEVGKMFRGKFTKANIQFGGVTPDFELGRELTVLDYGFRGRKLEDWAEPNEYTKKISVKGSTVEVLTGKEGKDDEIDYLLSGNMGAIVPLKSKEFPGVGFFVTLDSTVTAEEFEKMLKTIEVK